MVQVTSAGKQAKVVGEVACTNAEIEGLFKGKLIVSGVLNLKSTSNVEGEVSTQKLIVEAGATFNAQCKMQAAEEGVNKLTLATHLSMSDRLMSDLYVGLVCSCRVYFRCFYIQFHFQSPCYFLFR